NIIKGRWDLAKNFKATKSHNDVFKVDEVVNNDQNIVSMKEKSCNCRVINYEHLVCPHVLAVLQSTKVNMYMLCGEYYSRASWKKCMLLR
ncbi:hypothetical protein MKX01_020785, partial [Papaver californicum]